MRDAFGVERNDVSKSFVPRASLTRNPAKMLNARKFGPSEHTFNRTRDMTPIKATALKEKQPDAFKERLNDLRAKKKAGTLGKPLTPNSAKARALNPGTEPGIRQSIKASKDVQSGAKAVPKKFMRRLKRGDYRLDKVTNDDIGPSVGNLDPIRRRKHLLIEVPGKGQNKTDVPTKNVVAHELAHATANKSTNRRFVRLNQLATKPKSIGKEEARADYLSGTDVYHRKGSHASHSQDAADLLRQRPVRAWQEGIRNNRSEISNRPAPGKGEGYKTVHTKMKQAGTKRWLDRYGKN